MADSERRTSSGDTRVEAARRGPLTTQTDERTARADWRSSIVGATSLTILAGAWLIASPALLSYDRPALPVVCGAAIVLIGVLRLLAAPDSRTLVLAGAGAGALTAIAGFLAGDSAGPTANVALMGGAVVLLSLVSLAASSEARRRTRP